MLFSEPPVITPPSIKSTYNEGTKVDVTCNAFWPVHALDISSDVVICITIICQFITNV